MTFLETSSNAHNLTPLIVRPLSFPALLFLLFLKSLLLSRREISSCCLKSSGSSHKKELLLFLILFFLEFSFLLHTKTGCKKQSRMQPPPVPSLASCSSPYPTLSARGFDGPGRHSEKPNMLFMPAGRPHSSRKIRAVFPNSPP